MMSGKPAARVLCPTTAGESGGEHFGETNPRKRGPAFWQNEPESSAQHFPAPAGMIAATSQEAFEWTLD
jgi:hypothetical protein